MKRAIFSSILAVVGMAVLVDYSAAATLRFRQSGAWTLISDGTTAGWANNDGTPNGSLPGPSDDGRINFGNNTVSVTTAVPTLNRVQIGVDESGMVVVENGGTLTTAGNNGDLLAGNNNSNATGTLIVNDGGSVDVGRIFWAANENSDGVVDIQSGGQVTVASHLWWGVSGNALVDISGTLTQTGGILGLGTSDASTASGGTATVKVLDGGLLALNNISGSAGLPSIQSGSSIDISGTGELTVPGDFLGVLNDYANANKIGGNGVPGLANLTIDLTKNPGFTTAYVSVPEPTTTLLICFGLGGLLISRRR